MRYLLFSVFMLITGVLLAQNKALSKIPVVGKTIDAFIPAGYDTLAVAQGDLNKDKIDDYVLVLQSVNEKNTDPSVVDTDSLPARILVVIFKKANQYVLGVKTDKAIMCRYCGGVFGEPFDYVIIEKGVLNIHHYGGSTWRWSETHKFRYQKNEFYLIGETSYLYWNVSNCEALGEFAGTHYKDVNFITGDYEEKKVSDEGCKLLVNKKGKQKILPLKKLTAFSLEN
ncbi:MAG TPA: hypothetical protein VF487_10595 [Chitinophagaceae bacterium]